MRKFWPFSFFFLIFAAVAAHMPFLVLFYQQLGFSGAQIGFLAGVSPLITLISVPLWTRTADKTNRHKLIMGLSLLAVIACIALYPTMKSFAAVVTINLLANVFFSPVLSFANSATMYMLGDEKEMYGRLRMGGTIGFGVASLIAGILVERLGLSVAFWLASLFLFLCFLVSLKLEYGQEELVSESDGEGDLRAMLRNLNWIFLLILAVVGGASMAVGNSYFYPYLGELGASQSAMGLALTIGTIAEVPVLFLANYFIAGFKEYGTLIFSLLITGARLALFGLVDQTSLAMVIQLTNGLSIPLFLVAGVAIADKYSPAGMRTTGQGLFNAAMNGAGVALGGFLGGLLLASSGGQALFLVTGIAVLVVVLAVHILRSRLLDKPLLVPVD